ncbi:HD domain-containing protein [Dethiobacter alkaliphilus]|uniref:HD domain-containing protein n=1 Tax=Dethiobacter alkaliphilus TaxID=427926 RepID=UPI002226039B|nr:HD domain-containing protein [Dethiobacter alkaliphilus]MCW3490517.1 HD domain-containing protein [Dethiobacter alkaliphilus]
MDRVQKLTADPDYRRYLCVTAQYETERPFCRHDFNHLLDVARIAWILCLQRSIDIGQPVVYAAALLHDIGRFAQYEDKAVDHAAESARLAEPLLIKHGFTAAEISTILPAITAHRLPPETLEDPFSAVLAEADDLSRRCFDCTAQKGCYKFDRMATAKGIRY